jgi:putative tryptophan/tyrosine transport system permease protein
MSQALLGSLESGMIFAIMALGVYLTFRVLDFPDLTVDGSFTTGGSVAAAMIFNGYSPLLSTLVAFIAGMFFGAVTGILHTKGKINALLAGILSMIALYSINLRIMGKANIGLLGQDTLLSEIQDGVEKLNSSISTYAIILSMAVLALLIKLACDWFLGTEVGLALRATGDNPRMIRSFSANTDSAIILGLAISNGLVSLSGALMAQYQGFSDVSMGIGMIIIGLASVIIGEAVFGDRSIKRATFAVIGGALIYRLVVALALRVGLSPSDMKLMTALIVVAALVAPKIAAGIKEKRRKAARRRQAAVTKVNLAPTAQRGENHA